MRLPVLLLTSVWCCLTVVACGVPKAAEDKARTNFLADDPVLEDREPVPGWDIYRHRDKEVGGRNESDSPVNIVANGWDLPDDADLVSEMRQLVPQLEAAGWTRLLATCVDPGNRGEITTVRVVGLKDHPEFQARLIAGVSRYPSQLVQASISIYGDLAAFTDAPEDQDPDLSCLDL